MSQSFKTKHIQPQKPSVLHWFIQRIVLDGIFWAKRKPRNISGSSAIKILRYLALVELIVELIVLVFLGIILLTESYVKHEKEEYQFMVLFSLIFVAIRTCVNASTIIAPIRQKLFWLYPAYFSHLLFFVFTSLLLGLMFGGVAVTTVYYLIMEIKHSFIYFVLTLVSAGMIYLFIDFTRWIYGVLDSARFFVQGIRENTSNVTIVE